MDQLVCKDLKVILDYVDARALLGLEVLRGSLEFMARKEIAECVATLDHLEQ